jgi:hypothetical protein
VKQHASDCPFSYPKTATSQYYNDTSGIQTTMADIHLPTEQEKSEFYKAQRLKNCSSKAEQQEIDAKACEKLAKQFCCRRGMMLLREATQKGNPARKQVAHGFFWCDYHGCDRMAPYRFNC